jgi:hypothetical protein
MLAYTAVRLAEREGIPRDPESNALLESFIVHTRCLRDFLWGERKHHKGDAFAIDFCQSGVWERERGDVPPELAEVDRLRRAGREVMHLGYHRKTIAEAARDWDISEIYGELAHSLQLFAATAIPARLDQQTREALCDLMAHRPTVGPASVATGAVYGAAIRGALPGFHTGS